MHDYFVGETDIPDVTTDNRKKADMMFHEACFADGCSTNKINAILAIGLKNIEGYEESSIKNMSSRPNSTMKKIEGDAKLIFEKDGWVTINKD